MAIEKITRICWNTENWERPSGLTGKSKDKDSYEQTYHFGHEEWLFDRRMILSDGYLYGYLQALLRPDCHKGKTYDIHLFSINSDTQDRLYVGCLRNAEVLTDEEREWATKECKKLGLVQEMDQDLKRIGVKKWHKSAHPNVRFKLDQVELEYPKYQLIDPDSLIGHRYQLMDDVSERLKFLDDPREEIKPTQSTEDIICSVSTPTYVKKQKHKEIQLALKKYLSHKGYPDVELEADAGIRRQIDLKAYHEASQSWHYFEIKVYNARMSIREALGQILEYAHYLSAQCEASKLFIVGPESPTRQDLVYLNRLRKEYNLPIEFVHCSIKDERLYWEDDIRSRVGALKAIKQTTK
nr:hypothetical protein [uncultured Porphyromonas sp.]